MIDSIVSLLGDKADSLLQHECKTISTDLLHLPGRISWTAFLLPATATSAS